MDRSIVYPGAIPLDTDMLGANRNPMIALGALIAATLGTTTVVDGLAATPTSPASMVINIGPGSITSYTVVDANAYGSLGTDSDALMKMGINTEATPFTLTAPTTSGYSVAYLIQASFAEADGNPVALSYYNASNPSQPWTGPGNNGATQNTTRTQRVTLQLVPGAAAPSGSQTTPAVTAGAVGLYVITVANGQTTVTSGNIATYAGAPFIALKIPAIATFVSNLTGAKLPINTTRFLTPGSFSFTPLSTTRRVEVEVLGGGGGSPNTPATSSSQNGLTSGGWSGAYGSGSYTTGFGAPGSPVSVVVGSGGAAGAQGGTSSFGALLSATGGLAGQAVTLTVPNLCQNSTGGGNVNGANIISSIGSVGAPAMCFEYGSGGGGNGIGGTGGSSPYGAGGGGTVYLGGFGNPVPGSGFGAGGGGTYVGTSASVIAGAEGSGGLVIVREFLA